MEWEPLELSNQDKEYLLYLDYLKYCISYISCHGFETWVSFNQYKKLRNKK
jgi:hypothetical protein